MGSLDGAPKTASLSIHTPIEGKHVGLGGAIYHESIGPQSTNMIDVDFSYTLEFEESKLGFWSESSRCFLPI